VFAFLLMRPLLVGIATFVSGAAGQAAAIVAACAVITYCLTVSVWIVRWATETMRAGG
jgi:hypothetical protein